MCRAVATWLSIIFGSVLIALSLFEVYERAIAPPTPAWTHAQEMLYHAPGAFMRYHPYVELIEEPFSGAYPFTIVGDARATKEKAPGSLRVIVLGSSVVKSPALEIRGSSKDFAYSPRFNPPGAWWNRCADDLAAAGTRPVEVLPAGIPGAVTTNEVINILTADLLDWRPDAIVMLGGHNDVYASSVRSRKPGVDLFVPLRRFLMDHPLAYGVYQLFSWFEGANLLFETYAERNIAHELVRSTPEQVAERMTKNYAVAHAIAKGIGARFVIAHQPNDWINAQPATAEFFDRVVDYTQRWAAGEGVPFFSYLRLLSARRDLFYDPVHFTGEGYELLCAQFSKDAAPIIATAR